MPDSKSLQELVDVMRRLRGPDGCPWDRKQTHKTLKPHLMEECGEFLDSVEDSDDAGMMEELGDILMHVVLHSVMAEERGAFSFEDVAKVSVEKMRRRHPHVFGDAVVSSSEEVVGLWEEIKRREKEREGKSPAKSALDGVPRHCPALLQAEKLQRKAAKLGFDWSDPSQIIDKVEEELEELKSAMKDADSGKADEELGDILFAVVNLARFRGRDSSEELLARTNAKFSRRFRHIERRVAEQGRRLEDCSLAEMDALWDEAKSLERA